MHTHPQAKVCHYVVYGTTLVSIQFTYIHTIVNNIVHDIMCTGNNTWFIPTPLCGNTNSPYLAYNICVTVPCRNQRLFRSVAYFDCIAVFEAPYPRTSVKGGAHTRFVDA